MENGGDGEEDGEGDGEEDTAAFMERIHKEDEEAFESEAKAMIRAGDDKWEADSWLNRTGWAVHLRGMDKDRLRATMEPIRDDEPVLQRMGGFWSA